LDEFGKLSGPTMASSVVCFRIDSMSLLVTFNARGRARSDARR
jgi:hypothetical protein